MQPHLVVPANENPSFVASVEHAIRANVIWLGRTIKALYQSISPEVIRVARKVFDSLLPLLILQLFSWELRFICYMVAGLAALNSCISKVDWATAKVFRPFVFSIAADIASVAALSYITEPFPADIIFAAYILFYAGVAAMIATNLEEIFPDRTV